MGRAIHYDKGLGWTAGEFTSSCTGCGQELARSASQQTAETKGNRARCDVCQTRPAARRVGVSSLRQDRDRANGSSARRSRGQHGTVRERER